MRVGTESKIPIEDVQLYHLIVCQHLIPESPGPQMPLGSQSEYNFQDIGVDILFGVTAH